MKVLDSDLIIDFLNKIPAALSKVEELINSGEDLATTVFNEQEVLYGVLKTRRKDSEITKRFFDSINVLSYDINSVSNVVETIIDLENRGLPIGDMDVLIAGVCLTHDGTIVTRNVEHFSRIPGLKIESW